MLHPLAAHRAPTHHHNTSAPIQSARHARTKDCVAGCYRGPVLTRAHKQSREKDSERVEKALCGFRKLGGARKHAKRCKNGSQDLSKRSQLGYRETKGRRHRPRNKHSSSILNERVKTECKHTHAPSVTDGHILKHTSTHFDALILQLLTCMLARVERTWTF